MWSGAQGPWLPGLWEHRHTGLGRRPPWRGVSRSFRRVASEVAHLVGGAWAGMVPPRAGTHWGIPALGIVQHHENKRVQPPRTSRGGSRSQPCTPGRTQQWPASRAGGRSRLHTAMGLHQGESAFYLDPATGPHEEGSLQHPQLSGLQLAGLGPHF